MRKITFVLVALTLLLGACSEDDNELNTESVTDVDGNIYSTVIIGDQTWMAENLKTTRFNDGTPITLVPQDDDWSSHEPAYCWYNNSMGTYKDSYGALYNWTAVYNGNLCPTGWHVPSDAEWTELTDYLGGESIAGAKLKETGTEHWSAPNSGATNESGFTALPGGLRTNEGFENIGEVGYWWTSSADESSTFTSWCRIIGYWDEGVERRDEARKAGFSVRCVKD